MSSEDSNENGGNAVSIEAEALLAEKLQDLRDVTSSTLEALHKIFALVTGEDGDMEPIKELLVSMQGIETIIEATKSPADADLERLARVMTHLCGAYPKQRRTHNLLYR